MYLPNRIGPYPVLDHGRTLQGWPTEWNTAGNFDAVDSSITDLSPQFETATVRDDHDEATWIADTDMSLAANRVVSLAVAISGEHLNEKAMTFSGHVSLVGRAVGAKLSAEVFCGVLASSTISVSRTTEVNSLQSYAMLPIVTGKHDH